MTLRKVAKNPLFKNIKIVFLIFALSLLVNSYKLPTNLFFGHEQGRDAATIEQIYKNRDLRLIGTKTEIEGFFSPPWYYYLMTIPYGLSGGNPVVASFFLIFLTSTTAPIIYLLSKDIFKSTTWAIISGIIAALSWEIITYSRWLSNVTLAFPATAAAYLFLYKYVAKKDPKFLLLFAIFATVASQFQVTLTFQFLYVVIVLIILKVIKLPNVKISLVSIFFYILIFSPLIVFDFKNEHLIAKSLIDYAAGDISFNLNFNLQDSLTLWANQLTTVVSRSIFNVSNSLYRILFFSLLLFGLIKSVHPWGVLMLAPQGWKKNLLFVAVISFMSVGILIFNVGLTQLYQGTAIGWIILLTLSLSSLTSRSSTQVFAILLTVTLIFGWLQNYKNLKNNDNFFFAPEQNVLRLSDQKALIDFMHNDAEVKPYRFEAFTVPFLHSEGWQYLHQYYYPRQESKHSKLVYIAIEKNIPQFWQEKWIGDLGKTELIFKKQFGQIHLQKRYRQD